MNRLLITILISVNIAIFLIAYILAPLNADYIYWFSICWISFQFSLNWFASAAIVGKSFSQKSNSGNSLLGALPAINIVILFYSFFSISLLLLTTWLKLISWNLQLALQICTAIIFFVLVILLLVSARSARIAESEFVTKSQLLEEILRIKRKSANSNLTSEFNNITNYINYEMPHPSRLPVPALNDYYEQLCKFTEVDGAELDQLLTRLKSI